MPNNCSTLIQRKQNILHKVLRSNSEAVTETTSELRVGGVGKTSTYSSSANHLTPNATAAPATRRSNLFPANRIQPTSNHIYETHLPSIRDVASTVERQHQLYDDLNSRPHSKTPLRSISPKSAGRPQSASISSIFNTLSKRSTENFMSSNGEIDELIVPPSRHSQRPSNDNNKYATGTNHITIKQTIVPQKYSGDNAADSRYSLSPPNSSQQHQRPTTLSGRLRSAVSNAQVENPLIYETIAKERTNTGQLYQRRTNNIVKAPIKQKIDKYRRRSEEVTHATYGNTLMNTANAGLSATTPALATSSSTRSKPSPSPIPVRRVTSDAEIQARLEVLRLSMESNLMQTDHQQQQQQQNSRSRIKSPYLYATHQQLAPSPTPQTPPVLIRRSEPISSAIPIQHRQNNGVNYRRQQQSSVKHSTNTGQGNLYLAFIASRHLSTLEDTLYESDIDHPKLLRIFTWLKNVEEYRHQQSDHDKLIIEQNQRMSIQDDNLSLYSEIQYAVDDLPANTSGKPCEKIATMQFED